MKVIEKQLKQISALSQHTLKHTKKPLPYTFHNGKERQLINLKIHKCGFRLAVLPVGLSAQQSVSLLAW